MSSYGNGPGSRMPSGLPAEQGVTGVLSSTPDISMSNDLDRSGLLLPDNNVLSDFLPNYNPYASHNSFQQYMPMEGMGGINGPGAGPLPTAWGAQAAPNGGSTLTEFTKRRNWSQRLLEELRDFLHILTPDGRIVYVSASAETLTGYKVEDLVGKFIVEFIHQDDSAIFVREFNESIASGHSLRFFYRFRKSDGTYVIFESHGHAHLTTEAVSFGPNNAAGYCRGFFMMARPYPTKNASLLDSFLEHKIENERLTRRIHDLQKEEREEDENQRQMLSSANGQTPSDTPESPSSGPASDQIMLPPPPKPPISNLSLTQKNLDEVTAAQKQDSIKDKMARYEGATHIETIEMLTGLRYRDGERSQGISTGDMSPALIRGDAGIAISADKDGRLDKKNKKLKVADEFVCTDCGTLDSPEWRKGPTGPKTLCNACGLRWAKKEKKRTVTTPTQGPTPPGQGIGSTPQAPAQSQSPGLQPAQTPGAMSNSQSQM